MLGMKNHFDISGSIEIHKVEIAGVACIHDTSTYCPCLGQVSTLCASQSLRKKDDFFLFENWRERKIKKLREK